MASPLGGGAAATEALSRRRAAWVRRVVPECARAGVVPIFTPDVLGASLATEILRPDESADARIEATDEDLTEFAREVGSELEKRTGTRMRAKTSTIAVFAELKKVGVGAALGDEPDAGRRKLWTDVRSTLREAVVCVPHGASDEAVALVAIKNRWAPEARVRKRRKRRDGRAAADGAAAVAERGGRDFAHCTEVMMLVARDPGALDEPDVAAWLREVRQGLRPGAGSSSSASRGAGGAAPIERMSVKFFDNRKLQSPGGVHPRSSSLALLAACDAIRAYGLATERVTSGAEDRSWRFGVTPVKTYMMNVCVCTSARLSIQGVTSYMDRNRRGGIVRTDNTGVNCRFARISPHLVETLAALRRGEPDPEPARRRPEPWERFRLDERGRPEAVPKTPDGTGGPRSFFERVCDIGSQAFLSCARDRRRSPIIFFAGKREAYDPERPWSSKLIVTGQYDQGSMMVAMCILCHMFTTGVEDAEEGPCEDDGPGMSTGDAPDWLAALQLF